MSTLNINEINSKNNTGNIILENSFLSGIKNTSFVYPGCTVQKIVRMIRTASTASTGGAYYEYYAHFDDFKTKITAKYDNSAFYVRYGINGEPGNTHNWTLRPIRGFDGDAAINSTNWEIEKFGHYYDTESPSDQLRWYCSGYTNPGNYPDGDYDSTPILTCTMEILDNPEVAAGTDIWYSCVFQSTGNHTWALNRSINANTAGNYERGVSYIIIEEIAGPVTENIVETGVYEYTFG